MNKKKGRQIAIPIYIFVTVLAICFLYYAGESPHIDTKLRPEEVIDLEDGWTYISPSGETKSVNRNDTVEPNIPNGTELFITLPEKTEVDYDTLGVWSVFQVLEVSVDGKLVSSNADPTQSQRHLERNPGAFWNMIRLPEDCEGKTMLVRFTSPYPSYRSMLGKSYLGSYSAIYSQIQREYSPRVLLSMLFIAIGVLFLIFHIHQTRKTRILPSAVIISLFAIWFGIWCFSESHGASFYYASAPFVSMLSFVSVRMATISFILYFRSIFGREFRTWNGILLIALCGELIVSMILQLLQIRDFYESISFFLPLMGLLIVSLFVEILYSIFIKKSKESLYVLIATLFLGLFVSLDAFVLASGQIFHIPYGVSSSIGMLILISLITISEVKKTRAQAKLARHAEHFKELAVTDALTSLYNRNIESEWIASHHDLSETDKERAVVLVCDMNYLKSINDTYGHRYGDEAICKAAKLLQSVFGECGVVCRTGGDEFTIFSDKLDNASVLSKLQELQTQVLEIAQTCQYVFSLSVGYAFFDPNQDDSLEHTISRADSLMYHDKINIKKNLQLNGAAR